MYRDLPKEIKETAIEYKKVLEKTSGSESLTNDLLCGEDFEELKEMCRELLAGADKCGEEPHYIVQPFLGIVKRHLDIIDKYNLV